jgi:pimeloyl-ACP methyl ester carboxylesterase
VAGAALQQAFPGDHPLLTIGGILILLALLTGAYVALTWAPERSVEELRGRWARAPSIFLDVAGMRVCLREEGPRHDETPIVLIHGTSSSLHTWDGWAQALKSKRRVIRFDLQGFGLTGPAPDGNYSFAKDVALVIAILDRLDIKRCVLGGNSLGGTVSWRTALAHPSRVAKLILVDSGGYSTPAISVPLAFQLPNWMAGLPRIDWLVRNTLPRSLIKQALLNLFGDPGKVTPDMVERYYEIARREGNRVALFERYRQREPWGALEHRIPELRLPTLILWGGLDRLTPPGAAHRFHADIAGSKLVIFDDLGHLPQEEDPVRTVLAVQKFLKLEQPAETIG